LKRQLGLGTIALITVSVGCAVSAQLALERGTADLEAAGPAELLRAILSTPWVALGILSYGVGTTVWLMVLRRIDLAVAYPLGSSSLVIITLLSAFRLGEEIPLLRAVGIALIVGGIWVIGLGERRRPASP